MTTCTLLKLSETIGDTPLVELYRDSANRRLLVKLEQFNPTGAAKIRMAKSMIDAAERSGELPPGGTIVESTSGNTGLGLSVLAAERGYRFIAVVDNHASKDKLNAMRAMGAELVFVSPGDDDSLATSDRERHAEELAAGLPDAVFLRQHDNPANAPGYFALADEVIGALGRVPTHVVSPVGTGGCLFGLAERFGELGADTRIIGVEPEGSTAFGGPAHDYFQSGTGTPEGAMIGSAVRYELLDMGVKVDDRSAFATCRVIARDFGILLGGSSGGGVCAALELLPSFPPGSTCLTVACDGGEKYLDTVFDDDWIAARGLGDPAGEAHVRAMLAGTVESTAARTRITWRRGQQIPDTALLSPAAEAGYASTPEGTDDER